MWTTDNITPANMLFYPLYCNIISLTSLKSHNFINNLVLHKINRVWDIKVQNSVWITEGADNGDSDNQGPTVSSIC